MALKFSFRYDTESISVQALADVVSEIAHTVGSFLGRSSTEREARKDLLDSTRLVLKIAAEDFVGAYPKRKSDLLVFLCICRDYRASKARDHLFLFLLWQIYLTIRFPVQTTHLIYKPSYTAMLVTLWKLADT